MKDWEARIPEECIPECEIFKLVNETKPCVAVKYQPNWEFGPVTTNGCDYDREWDYFICKVSFIRHSLSLNSHRTASEFSARYTCGHCQCMSRCPLALPSAELTSRAVTTSRVPRADTQNLDLFAQCGLCEADHKHDDIRAKEKKETIKNWKNVRNECWKEGRQFPVSWACVGPGLVLGLGLSWELG